MDDGQTRQRESRPGRWVDVDLFALAHTGPVHFVGIAGAGMSALAMLLLRSGGQVTGCDLRPGEIGGELATAGATVSTGHDAAHVASAVAVVTTAAAPHDHAELLAARRRGIPVLKRAQALGAIVNRGTVLAIAGTHGKSTTTAMTTEILAEAGLDPTGFVGGRMPGWGGGLRPGSSHLFVVEADEFDRSFLTLRPTVAVVTAVEADHLDVFGSFEAVEDAFRDFASQLRPGGRLFACVDDPGARRLLEFLGERGVGYGLGAGAALCAVRVEPRERGSRFLVRDHGEVLGEVVLAVPGMHNVRNALGALSAALATGADIDAARRALAHFRGVARRFQELGDAGEVTVVDDYAHHPTEIEATLAAARLVYPGRRLVVVFQPHLYTRTRDFAEGFGRALASADAVSVTDIYAAREAPIPGVTGELVARAAAAAGATEVHYHPRVERLPEEVATFLRAGDVCLTLGAGDIDDTARAVLARLRERA